MTDFYQPYVRRYFIKPYLVINIKLVHMSLVDDHSQNGGMYINMNALKLSGLIIALLIAIK